MRKIIIDDELLRSCDNGLELSLEVELLCCKLLCATKEGLHIKGIVEFEPDPLTVLKNFMENC